MTERADQFDERDQLEGSTVEDETFEARHTPDEDPYTEEDEPEPPEG